MAQKVESTNMTIAEQFKALGINPKAWYITQAIKAHGARTGNLDLRGLSDLDDFKTGPR